MTVKNFENYEIFSNGKILSKKTGKFLIPLNNGNGYLKVNLHKNGNQSQHYIHRLVAEAYLPNPHGYKYVDHIDRDKTNNHVYNLRWCSAKQNTANTAGKPRYSVSKSGKSHYSEETKDKVRTLFKLGLTVSEIASKMNIPRQSVSRFIKDGH